MKNIQEVVEIPKFISLVEILGAKDKYLDCIKNDTDVNISVKDSAIYVFGKEAEVKRIVNVFERLLEMASTKENITKEETQILLQQSKNGELYRSDDESVILKYGKKVIKARTESQMRYLRSMRENDITVCAGPAGTSKTYSAVCYGLSLLINKEVDKIILTRPMVEAKGENKLGSLPGEVESKLGIYLLPMTDVFERVLGKEKLENYIERGKIQMVPLGYMRGLSFYRTFTLADEFESTNPILAKLLVTRIGEGSKIVVCGDRMQQDSYGMSGLTYLVDTLKDIRGVGIVKMDEKDVVRHSLIAPMLKAFEKEDRKLGINLPVS